MHLSFINTEKKYEKLLYDVPRVKISTPETPIIILILILNMFIRQLYIYTGYSEKF